MSTINTPHSELELSQFVSDAARVKKALKIIGGGTKQTLGHRVEGEIVSTVRLSGITLYEPAALTIVAQAGTPLREIEEALKGQGQHLPFEPTDYRKLLGSRGEATIGGIVACAISGPRRIQAGACRDSLIGVRFVNGEGDIIKSGGRVMKNVTGYDLVKLLAGSYGTLGILTQLSFKLLPAPQKTAVVLITGLDDGTAVNALSAALGSPFDISAAAHTPNGIDGEPVSMFRLEGFEKSVDYRAVQLRDLLNKFGSGEIETNPDNTKAGWRWVGDVEAFANKTGAVWKLSLKPGDSVAVVKKIRHAREIEVLYDWGGGLVWLLTPSDEACGEGIIRAEVDRVGGHATLIRQCKQSSVENVFHPQPAPIARISAALRAKFDPHTILNPGRMGA